MISRVADQCFWFGRYLERAESTARVMVVTQSLALDAELTPRQCWLPVVIVSGVEKEFVEKHGSDAVEDPEKVQDYMTWAEDNLASIRRSVSAARDNARSIREVLSTEVWLTINELYLWLRSEAAHMEYVQRRYDFFRHIREAVQLNLGLMRSTMLHDTALDFIWLGVLLERANQTARVLDVHHHILTLHITTHQVVETGLWLSLLRACSGFEPFMKQSQGRVTPDNVAAFLILEQRFPRSIRYCVHAAFERLCTIRPPEEAALPGGRSLQRLSALDAWLKAQTPASLSGRIHETLTQVVDETSSTCEALGFELFGYAGGPAQSQSAQSQTQGA